MGTPHRLSLIALSRQIQFCATRHHPDVRLPLLTVSILSFVGLVTHGQTKNPAYIAVSRVWKFVTIQVLREHNGAGGCTKTQLSQRGSVVHLETS